MPCLQFLVWLVIVISSINLDRGAYATLTLSKIYTKVGVGLIRPRTSKINEVRTKFNRHEPSIVHFTFTLLSIKINNKLMEYKHKLPKRSSTGILTLMIEY